jgi:hypothetical protein
MSVAFPKPTPVVRVRKRLRTKTPLRRTRWGIRPRRPRRLDGPGSDPARLAAVRLLPCALLKLHSTHRCEGRIEACHEAKKPGVGMKCPDSGTMPMCTLAHGWWTRHTGFFKNWPKAKRRTWADERIAEATALLLSHGGRRG